jgi:SPP1 family predicted phage head-tail adaptor
MRPGQLNRRVKLYAQTRTPDGAGGWTEGWSEWGTVWAQFVPMSAGERMEAMAHNIEVEGRVNVRYRADLPVPAVMDYDGRYLESVGGMIDAGDRRQYGTYEVRKAQQWRPES